MHSKILILTLCLALTACGATHKYKAAHIKAEFIQGNYCQTAAVALSERNLCSPEFTEDEELDFSTLNSLNGGAALFADNKNEYAGKVLDLADKNMAEYLDANFSSTKRTTTALIANESILDYNPKVTDNLYINSYKILNALALNDKVKARIEIKKGYEKQKEASKIFKKQIAKAKEKANEDKYTGQSGVDKYANSITVNYEKKYSQWKAYKDYMNPYLTYLSGLFLLHNANDSADLETALTYLKRSAGMVNNKYVKQDLKEAKARVNGRKDKSKYVWVIFENGLAPELKEERIDIPIFVGDGRLQWISFAMPVPEQQMPSFDSLDLNYKGSKTVYSTQELMSVDKTFISEYNKLFPSILTKALSVTVSKAIAQYIIEKEQGPMAGAIMMAYNLATTTADLRTWGTLPKDVQLAKFKLVKNKKLEIFGNQTKLGEVDLPNANSIVYVRVPAVNAKPAISIIKL